MLLALLSTLAPALPDSPPAVQVQQEEAMSHDFAPFDFGPEPLPVGPIRMVAPRRIPEPVAARIAQLLDEELVQLAARNEAGTAEMELGTPTTRRADLGGGLELWIVRSRAPSCLMEQEHHHFLYAPASGRVGPTASWGARYFDLDDDDLEYDRDAAPSEGMLETLLRRTDLDADGMPELALHSVEHNGTMWGASALLVVDVAADLSLHHAVKLLTRVYEVPTDGDLVTRWEAAPGGPVVHWRRLSDDLALAGPIGRQWLGREAPGRPFTLLRHETDDELAGWLLEQVRIKPAGGFAGGP